MEEHLELVAPQLPFPQKSAIAQTIQQRLSQQVQKTLGIKKKWTDKSDVDMWQ